MLHFSYYPASEAGPCDETAHLGQGTLARLQDPKAKTARYRPPDSLLHFLTTL
jgi:hypothetical protein